MRRGNGSTNPTPIILLYNCNMCFLTKYGLLLSLFPPDVTNALCLSIVSHVTISDCLAPFNKANLIKDTLHPALPEV